MLHDPLYIFSSLQLLCSSIPRQAEFLNAQRSISASVSKAICLAACFVLVDGLVLDEVFCIEILENAIHKW